MSPQIHYNTITSVFKWLINQEQPENSSTKTQCSLRFQCFEVHFFSLPVCNGGFGALSLVAGNVFMEVGQAAGHGLCYVTQLAPGHSVTLQVVGQ